jgi:phospholipase A1
MVLPRAASSAAAADCEAPPPSSERSPCPLHAAGGIQPHKLNYVLIDTRDFASAPDERQADETKFQFSLKAPLPGKLPWYFGYTQKSYWQIYDGPHSRPFRESNYNPEIFLDWRAPLGAGEEWTLRYGLEHESNGQTIERTRSWNRAYLWPRYDLPGLSLSLKYWYRFPEPKKTAATDPQGDENPNILGYLGRFEAYAAYTAGASLELSGMYRRGTLDPIGTVELNALTDLGFDLGGSIRFIAQYFSGYGESLIDYDHRVDKFGLGVTFR